MKDIKHILVATAVASFLVACGGGSNGNDGASESVSSGTSSSQASSGDSSSSADSTTQGGGTSTTKSEVACSEYSKFTGTYNVHVKTVATSDVSSQAQTAESDTPITFEVKSCKLSGGAGQASYEALIAQGFNVSYDSGSSFTLYNDDTYYGTREIRGTLSDNNIKINIAEEGKFSSNSVDGNSTTISVSTLEDQSATSTAKGKYSGDKN